MQDTQEKYPNGWPHIDEANERQAFTPEMPAAPTPVNKSRSWRKWIIGGLIGACTLGIIGGAFGGSKTEQAAPQRPATDSAVSRVPSIDIPAPPVVAPPQTMPPAPPVQPTYTNSQEQAIAMAQEYLDSMAFSRSGLIEQLRYEKFSAADAEFAVAHVTVDWNAQAKAMAKDYLDAMAFSRSGLIEQLRYEGFTLSQATYGVNAVGL